MDAEKNCKKLPLQYVEQITLNKGGIACLDGRVGRAESDICQRYTKDEVNCMLAGKADKCAFEKHLLECHKCCKPICDCDCYTRDEVDALLGNKVNIDDQVAVHVPEFINNYSGGQLCRYWKDKGIVYLRFSVRTTGANYNNNNEMAVLPEGFRPAVEIRGGAAAVLHTTRTLSWYYISADGVIKVPGLEPSSNAAMEINFFVAFPAA